MKRFIALLAAIAVAVTFISFGRNANADSAASPESPADSAQSAAGDKILVAYFTAAENSGVDAVSSASYTLFNSENVGTVRAVAGMIAERTGGDLFSIRTSVVYPTARHL